MNKYLVDFNKLFENYAANWYLEHKGELSGLEQFNSLLPQIYEQWTYEPCPQLGNLVPKEFFERIEKPKLLDILINTIEADINPCMLLLDRIADEFDLSEPLCDIVDEHEKYKSKLVLIALKLLREMGIKRKTDDIIIKRLINDQDEEIAKAAKNL